MGSTRDATLFGAQVDAARARRRLTGEELFESQRGRLLQAVVAAVAEKGYPAVTIADIVAAAAVSRNAFYDHFTDKLGCFLAALHAVGDLLVDEVLAVEPDPDDWTAGTRARVRAALGALEALPGVAQVLVVDAPSAGREAQRALSGIVQRLAAALHAEQRIAVGHDAGLPDLPPAVFAAVTGGLLEMLRTHLLNDPEAHLIDLEADMVLFLRLVHEADPRLLRA